MTDIYADKGWIVARIAFHWVFLIPMLYGSQWIISSAYSWIAFITILLAYAVLTYEQLHCPLVAFDEESIIYRNFFYKGKEKIFLKDIQMIDISGNKFLFKLNGYDVQITLSGMSSKNIEACKEVLVEAAKTAGINLKGAN